MRIQTLFAVSGIQTYLPPIECLIFHNTSNNNSIIQLLILIIQFKKIKLYMFNKMSKTLLHSHLYSLLMLQNSNYNR